MNIFVAMSGGVDSSVAAALLKEQGHQVTGITMQLWPRAADDDGEKSCCGLEAIDDARRVAEAIGIPHYVVNMRDDFEKSVIENFVSEYSHGRTPNPCVKCNEIIKFDLLLKKAVGMDADALATGHYARISPQFEIPKTKNQKPNTGNQQKPDENQLAAHGSRPAAYRLLKGLDEKKDQSYFLWTFTQEQLAKTVFPLGGMEKTDVRDAARRLGLPVAEKSESQEICFVPADNYRVFLRERGVADTPGLIINTAGNVVGKHQGTAGYTVGQRKGLGIASLNPLYVIAVDADNNAVIVGSERDLFRKGATCDRFHMISGDYPVTRFSASARVRYNAPEVKATVTPIGGTRINVEFHDGQKGIAPGQSIVFYRDNEVLGGAVIK